MPNFTITFYRQHSLVKANDEAGIQFAKGYLGGTELYYADEHLTSALRLINEDGLTVEIAPSPYEN
jgi:hypothetical protein